MDEQSDYYKGLTEQDLKNIVKCMHIYIIIITYSRISSPSISPWNSVSSSVSCITIKTYIIRCFLNDIVCVCVCVHKMKKNMALTYHMDCIIFLNMRSVYSCACMGYYLVYSKVNAWISKFQFSECKINTVH